MLRTKKPVVLFLTADTRNLAQERQISTFADTGRGRRGEREDAEGTKQG